MTILQKTLILIYLLLPLQFAISPVSGVDLAIIRIFIICLVLYFLIYALYKRSFLLPHGWHMALFTFFATYILFSLYYSPVPTWTIRKILFFYSIFPLYYLLAILFRTKNDLILTQVCKAIVGGATIASLIGVAQFCIQFTFSLQKAISLWTHVIPFFLGGTFSTTVITYNSWLVHIGGHDLMRAIAFFPDPHVFSFYLGLIIPFGCALYVHTLHKKWLLATILLVIADLLTFSRGGYIALLFGLFLGVTLFWAQINMMFKHILIAILLSVCLFFLIPHNPVTQRFFSSFDTSDTSNTHRLFLWKQAHKEIIARPLFGTGLGAYPTTIDSQATYRTPIYVHNLFLDIAVELGLVGLLSFLSIIFYTIVVLYRHKHTSFAIFAIIGLGIFLVHAIFDTPLFSVHVLPILLFIFALAAFYEKKSFQKTLF